MITAGWIIPRHGQTAAPVHHNRFNPLLRTWTDHCWWTRCVETLSRPSVLCQFYAVPTVLYSFISCITTLPCSTPIPLPSNALFTLSTHPIHGLPLGFTPFTSDQICSSPNALLLFSPHPHSNVMLSTVLSQPTLLQHRISFAPRPSLNPFVWLHMYFLVTVPLWLYISIDLYT